MAALRTANGAPSLADRAEQRVDQIARRIVDYLVESIPAYGKLPEEQLGGEILAIARHNVELFMAHLRTGEPPDLETIRASAIRRAEERVPLDALLEAYHLGASLLWETIRDEARPGEVDEVLAAAAVVFSYLRWVSMTVADAYLEEREALSVEERDARRALLEAVLEGRSTEGAATRSGIHLAPRLVVLAVALGASPDEERPGVSRAVAARRKQRRIEERLLADLSAPGSDGVQTLLGPGGGTILVPTDEPGTIDLGQLVGSLTAAGPCEVWAAAAWAPSHAAVPGALAEARQVLRLAREGGRPPGGYRLADVLLDHLVSQPEAAGPLLGLLQPLEEGSDLAATLEAWFAVDFDRRATAAALVIHPNTLDYRLRRISELTGLDLRTAEAIQLLGAALLARRQAAASDRPDM